VSRERYVLLGLAPARSPWFESVAQWSNSASIAAEFIKCVSVEEVRARLASGRPHSALLVDAAMPSFDRDLVHTASEAATPVILVRDRMGPTFRSRDIGVVSELDLAFSRDDLIDVLAAHCRQVGRGDLLPASLVDPLPGGWLGHMYTVCGSGGTGSTTIAMALAQGMASDARNSRRVVLADLALRAEQAMLHDAIELGPGVQELVEAHRLSNPDPEEVRRMTFEVPRRGYQLLLGLRQPHSWSALRPRSVDAALEGLRRAFQIVVADATGDFEGEAESGSADVQERNHLARASVLRSTVVLAVGSPGLKGIYSLAALIRGLVTAGVEPMRILPVVNRAPRNPRARAEVARALAALLDSANPTSREATGNIAARIAVASPVAVPERKLEDLIREGAPLPGPIVEPVVRAVTALFDRIADLAPASADPQRIVPGSLGTWTDSDQIGAGS
jgi:MinD-like ATPase involved in chromosome partitioning or flagellar assembly